ncbi:MAG: NAD-dependent epimerase/dehydratase family protein [Phycisphaeraceae bacterium]|nr:NAD-dependent epimerase/dehydratase family protein [Phycisphaeraceae bacterium]
MSDYDLVTGGAGFIGSHLCRHLIELGRSVVVVDDFSSGRRANLSGLEEPNLKVIAGNIAQVLAEAPDTVARARRVFHLAATVGVRRVVDDPCASIRNNLSATHAVIDLAVRYDRPVLLTSSSEVYGQALSLPLRESDAILFGPTTSLRWSYGMTKALMEHEALALGSAGRLRAAIVRLFNTIGPGQVGAYGMVVPRFIEQAIAGQPLTVYGDGAQSRCFCDVRDVVPAMTALLERESAWGGVFNLGSDQPTRILDLAGRIIQLAGGRSTVQLIGFEEAFGRGFDEPRDRVPDLSRIRREIGFQPKIPLGQTLGELTEAFRSRA